jgi:Fe-S cluster assembly ATP-binding protein
MLEISDLHVDVDGKEILSGINLTVKPGETHAIMGPNGSGKSTLSHVIAGREGYTVSQGEIVFNGKSLVDLEPEERAGEGVFLAFQYPIEIAGVNNVYMLKAALNGIRNYRGEKELTSVEFLKLVKSKVKAVGLDESLLNRQVNSGFSGGEKKRNEIFQLSVLEPMLAVLDETDSGLDIDALKAVSDGVNKLRDASRSFVVITHYQRLLDYIVPDYVHVLAKGKIIKTGDKELARTLESKGYDWLTDSQESAA